MPFGVLSASLNQHNRSLRAPAKMPFSWPNNSCSSRRTGGVTQLSFTIGPSRRVFGSEN